MATVSQPKKFNHEETQRSVQNPLQLLRKYIRRYIILEGLALTLLCASVLFWLGLAFDFGLYKFDVALLNVHGIDWILELNDMDPTGVASLGVRIIVLTVIVVGLLALGFTKVVWRWVREFNDQALALVLERRFHKELGDRLITAVELADPTLAKKYGYSQAMVEKTILDAVAILKSLPVGDVFNWRRLNRMWLLLGLSTVGLFLVNMTLFCIGSYSPEKGTMMSPYGFSWRFYDVASIWTERNVFMMDAYWPRRAHLEIENFQPGKSQMRVARDDIRPELQVRAFEYVISDRKAPHGWRALKWKDLSERKLIDQEMLDRVTIPTDFKHWQVDLDELDSPLITALFGDDTRGRKSGDLQDYLQTPNVSKKVKERGAEETLARLLNWQEWSVDKLKLQASETEVRTPMREFTDYDHVDAVFTKLDELVELPSMSRTIRKLAIPKSVEVTFQGEESGSTDNPEMLTGNKFRVTLDGLKDSTNFKFRARGDDYFTPRKVITLVAAATAKSMTIDKEEPAYIYHRLFGPDQMLLKGKRHLTKDFGLSITGDSNTIEVPLGTKLTLHMKTDRKLRNERPVFVKDEAILAAGFDIYRGSQPTPHPEFDGFSLEMNDITRKHDFTVEFFDEDNIRGRRRYKILPTIDNEPSVGNLNLFSYLGRKPKFKTPAVPDKEKDKDKEPRDLRDQLELGGAYLITPDARIPLECSVKDDYGLVRVGYHYKYRKVDFELIAQGGKQLPSLEIDATTRRYHAGVVMSNFQFWPGNPLAWHFGAGYLAHTLDKVQGDIRLMQGYREGYIPSAGFRELLERRTPEMIGPGEIKNVLTKNRSPRAWEFEFKEDPGFDVQKYLQELKTTDPDKIGQLHYHLQIAVQATDNNVETGAPYIDENTLALRGNTKKNGNGYLSFIIVSENELLAQIALEEDILLEKLEAAKEKVDAGIVSLLEQQSKTREEKADLESILNRMNEIRTALGSAGTNLRESHQAYENILMEMFVNRVRSDRVNKIKELIITRLDRIVKQDAADPASGSFARAEEAFQKAHQLVDEEVSAKRSADVEGHRLNMTDANRQMTRLSDDIKALLDAMQEGIVENKLIALIVLIEQRQREHTDKLDREHRRIVEEELRKLIGDEPKKEPKKEEKKTSRLERGSGDGLVQLCRFESPEDAGLCRDRRSTLGDKVAALEALAMVFAPEERRGVATGVTRGSVRFGSFAPDGATVSFSPSGAKDQPRTLTTGFTRGYTPAPRRGENLALHALT